MTLALLDTVVLTRDLPESGLRSGDVGAIVEVYEDAYEVEFVTGAGRTQALLALSEADLRRIGSGDLLAVRSVSQSA